MSKAKAPKTTEAPSQPIPANQPKQPAIKLIVTGQVVARDDRRKDIKKYEETFIIPTEYKNSALSVVLRCLLPHRLSSKTPNFAFIRTHEIKGGITPVEDAGLNELYKKNVWDMDPEELRQFALFIGLKSPEYQEVTERSGGPGSPTIKKRKLLRTLNALAIIKGTPVDFDLKEKVEAFLKSNPISIQKPATPQPVEESEETEESETEAADETAEKAAWESLD